MAAGRHALALVLLGLLVVTQLGCSTVEAAKKKKAAEVLSANKLAKYIGCQGCMAFSSNLFYRVNKLIDGKGRKKLGETAVLEMLEDFCEPFDDAGEWITKIDVQGTKGLLGLTSDERPSACKSQECKAVQKVCEDVRSEVGEGEIASMVYRGHYFASEEQLATGICKKMTSFCPSKELKRTRVDEPFKAMDDHEYQAKKLMRNMPAGSNLMDMNAMREAMGEDGDMGDYGDDVVDADDMPPQSHFEKKKDDSLLGTMQDMAVQASNMVTNTVESAFSVVSNALGFGGVSSGDDRHPDYHESEL
eukprot:CAMPEP_0206269704 /NCGR_PEP_ID=MMETSP0047_2-20121206/32450_1 /ASSEMBLY_ACC=CAM_ASM_000192 /TAXON_ID=195065 /ORGANISM="Chroomonas mesostigmatica_cf, Strain CCMP1168" /LENGTH=303 /DNA_ID=CAMNT_0053698243 /DNA_START=10 /DNA_END=921 /DNA_ORIENTATION=+